MSSRCHKRLQVTERRGFLWVCPPMLADYLSTWDNRDSYRNIQTLITYIQAAQSDGYQHFEEGLPSIFEIQDKIEQAWDLGYNDSGRLETGGIKGTRKYIGTPEVCPFVSKA